MEDIKSRICAWTAEHKDEFAQDLAELIAIRSVGTDALPGKPYGEECARVLDKACLMAEKYGFSAMNRQNYVATADFGDGERALDILAHLDVVGEGQGWDTDPYVLHRNGDMIYGRGVADDKGPALAALYAMRCVRDLGLPISRSMRLILGADEESGSSDIAWYYSHEKNAPNTFTPDATFPVYNTEKGMYRQAFGAKFDKTDALPRVTRFDGGFRINVLPGDADADVLGLSARQAAPIFDAVTKELGVRFVLRPLEGGFTVAAHGKQAHASLPEDGNNAITGLICALSRLPLADCGSSRAIRGIAEVIPHGDWRGRALGIAMEDELSGPTTVVFSLMHLDEDGFDGQYDSRVALCANKENCLDVAQAVLSSKGFTVQGGMIPGHHTPGEGEFVSTLLDCYKQITGEKGECLSMGGGTYVHDIPGGVAFGPCMPGFDSREHGANEVTSLTDLMDAAAIYAMAIARLCK